MKVQEDSFVGPLLTAYTKRWDQHQPTDAKGDTNAGPYDTTYLIVLQPVSGEARTLVGPNPWNDLSHFLDRASEIGLLSFHKRFKRLGPPTGLTLTVPVHESRLIEFEMPWIAKFRHVIIDSALPSVLHELLTKIDAILKAGRLDSIDRLLSGLSVADYSSATLAALLRFTYPAREQLSAWKDFLGRTRQTMDRRGEDSDGLLRGLESK